MFCIDTHDPHKWIFAANTRFITFSRVTNQFLDINLSLIWVDDALVYHFNVIYCFFCEFYINIDLSTVETGTTWLSLADLFWLLSAERFDTTLDCFKF